MPDIRIRRAGASDRGRIARTLADRWGSPAIVAHGQVHDASALPALIAERNGELAGLLTYAAGDDGLEIVTLDALVQGVGVGTALLAAVATIAREAKLGRLWLITTNDNLDALRFYQRRGLRIVGIDAGAVDVARGHKPSIPLAGEYGIEIHDEITLELRLPGAERRTAGDG